MRQSFSKLELRALSSIIAGIILLGSLSLCAAVVVVTGPNHPELTIDICQPLQASCVTTSILLARPAPPVESGFILCNMGSIFVRVIARLNAEPAAPDTPPPEQFV